MSVYRCYSVKKPGFDVEARGLCRALQEQLGVQGLKSVTVLNRYDADQISQDVYDQAKSIVFSEPQVDTVYDETFPVPGHPHLSLIHISALGSALLISQRSYSLPAALIFALCGGIGATVALASFAGLQNEVDLESCPRSFRGIPIQLITAGLMAMALVGYYGLHLD